MLKPGKQAQLLPQLMLQLQQVHKKWLLQFLKATFLLCLVLECCKSTVQVLQWIHKGRWCELGGDI